MTEDAVWKAVHQINSLMGDPERAHSAEDDLYLWVLTAIASGEIPPDVAISCAKAAITTQDFEFPRWTA